MVFVCTCCDNASRYYSMWVDNLCGLDNTCHVQVYLDKSDWLVAKNASDLLKSDLDETNSKVLKYVAKLKRELWLAPLAFSQDLGRKANPKVPCFVWWSKHLLDTKENRVRFIPTPRSYVSPNSSVWRPSGNFQISDSLRDLGFVGGASKVGNEPCHGLDCVA